MHKYGRPTYEKKAIVTFNDNVDLCSRFPVSMINNAYFAITYLTRKLLVM